MSYQTHHQTHFPCNKGHIYRYNDMYGIYPRYTVYGKKTWCVAVCFVFALLTKTYLKFCRPALVHRNQLHLCLLASNWSYLLGILQELRGKIKIKRVILNNLFLLYSCNSGDVLITLQIIDCRFRC